MILHAFSPCFRSVASPFDRRLLLRTRQRLFVLERKWRCPRMSTRAFVRIPCANRPFCASTFQSFLAASRAHRIEYCLQGARMERNGESDWGKKAELRWWSPGVERGEVLHNRLAPLGKPNLTVRGAGGKFSTRDSFFQQSTNFNSRAWNFTQTQFFPIGSGLHHRRSLMYKNREAPGGGADPEGRVVPCWSDFTTNKHLSGHAKINRI